MPRANARYGQRQAFAPHLAQHLAAARAERHPHAISAVLCSTM